MDLDWESFMSTDLVDYFGFEIKVGDRLLRPIKYGCSSSHGLQSCIVTKIENGKMYLDDSKVAIKFPGRCVNISHLRTMS